jgi:4-aminobutyrate aminotransferase
VCCAAALATLDLVENGLMANAERLGARLIGGARKLAERHDIIGDVRGRGLMVGMELVKDRASRAYNPDASRKLVDTAFQHGLLLLGCGKSVVRLAPPLVIDEVDIDRGLSIIDDVLDSHR